MTPCLHIMSLCILRHENVVPSAVYDCLVVAVICYASPPPVLPLSAITDTPHYEEHTQLSARLVVVTTSRWQTTPRRALPASNDLSLSLSFLLLFFHLLPSLTPFPLSIRRYPTPFHTIAPTLFPTPNFQIVLAYLPQKWAMVICPSKSIIADHSSGRVE